MSKTTILFLAANPGSTSRLEIGEELRTIEQKVQAATHGDSLVFQSAWAVRPDDLLQLLNQHHPQVVHFSGHGSSEGLSLSGNDGRDDRLVTTRALQELFKTLKGQIRLVLLNACYSREQAQGLAEIIDCVIGMKESIHDFTAITFASSFYRAIGFGHSVQGAFDQGRTALLLEGISEEDVPELLIKDGVDPKQIVLIGHNDSVLPPVPLSSSTNTRVDSRPVDLFISSTHKDKDLCDQLIRHLANLRHQKIIRDWHAGDLIPGTDWRKEIQKQLDGAQILLLLISSDYLTSDFCYSVEMKRAIERHKQGTVCVLPVLLRPTDYTGAPFEELAMLPSNGKPVSTWTHKDMAFQDIIKGIRKAIKTLPA